MHHDALSQGTIAVEFLEQVPDLDAILVPISGGGMTSGIALATKHIRPSAKIFAVEPKGKDLEKCLKAGNSAKNSFLFIVKELVLIIV